MSPEDRAAVAPVRKQVRVNVSVEEAFRTFTDGIGSWWPVDTHSISVAEDGSNPPVGVVFEQRGGGRVYEQARDGRECEWATILAYEPPVRVVLAWHVNPVAETEVEVLFRADGDGTLVELEHRGWERYPGGGGQERAGYDSGWTPVLARYVERAGLPG